MIWFRPHSRPALVDPDVCTGRESPLHLTIGVSSASPTPSRRQLRSVWVWPFPGVHLSEGVCPLWGVRKVPDFDWRVTPVPWTHRCHPWRGSEPGFLGSRLEEAGPFRQCFGGSRGTRRLRTPTSPRRDPPKGTVTPGVKEPGPSSVLRRDHGRVRGPQGTPSCVSDTRGPLLDPDRRRG